MHQRVRGLVGRELARHADAALTGTSTAVGDGKGLMEVEVADICADEAGVGPAALAVHIGTIHVDQSAAVVHDLEELTDVYLEDAVRTRVGDHGAGEAVLILLRLGAEVLHVDHAALRRLDDHRLQSGEGGGGGVGAVSRLGEEDYLAVLLSVVDKVLADGAETGVLTCGTGVGHKGDVIKSCDRAEHLAEAVDHLEIALHLL